MGGCASVVSHKSTRAHQTTGSSTGSLNDNIEVTTTIYNLFFFFGLKDHMTPNTGDKYVAPAAPASSAKPALCVGPRREMNREGARQLMFRAACTPLDERASAVASPWGKV
jgi:hypothetical protein